MVRLNEKRERENRRGERERKRRRKKREEATDSIGFPSPPSRPQQLQPTPLRGSFSASERALAFNSLPLFEALQGELLRSGTRSPTWGKAVRSYASDISALMLMKGMSETENADGDDSSDDAAAAAAASAVALAVERCAWDWTALLFLPAGREDGCLGPALRRWASLHAAALLPPSPTPTLGPAAKPAAAAAGETLPSAVARLLSSPAPEREPGFWQTAARAAALGSYGAAVSLLGAHSAWNEALAPLSGGGGAGGEEAAFGGGGDDGQQQQQLDPDRRRAVASLAALEPVGLLLRRAPRLALGEGEGGARVFGAGDDDDDDFGEQSANGAAEATAFASLPTFLEARRSWLATVRAVAHDDGLWSRAAGGVGEGDASSSSSSAATAAGARRLLAVVAGDRTALDEAVAIAPAFPSASPSCSWAELLVARALHAGSGAGPRGAAELAHAAQRAFEDSEKMTTTTTAPSPPVSSSAEIMTTRDALLLSLADAAARGEPESAAAVLSSACGSWLLAHVAPLLASGSSSGPSSSSSSMGDEGDVSSNTTRGTFLPHAGLGSVEWAAGDYAAALAGGGGGETASSAAAVATRAAAARVFALCPSSGRSSCAALFHHSAAGVVSSSSAAGDDAPAERAAAEAERLGIRGAGLGVARAAGTAAAASGRVGAALRWFARAGDGDRARAAAGPIAEACAEALLLAGGGGGGGAGGGMDVDSSTRSSSLFASPAAAAAALEDLAAPLSVALSAPTRAPVPRRGGLRALRALLELERAETALLVASPSSSPSAAKAAAAVVSAAAAVARAAPSALFAAGALLRAVPALESGSAVGIPASTIDDALAAMAEAEAEARRSERVATSAATKRIMIPTSALAADAVRLALARALARSYLTTDSASVS